MRVFARGGRQCLHVVEKVNYGSSLYSELQGGYGHTRRYVKSNENKSMD